MKLATSPPLSPVGMRARKMASDLQDQLISTRIAKMNFSDPEEVPELTESFLDRVQE